MLKCTLPGSCHPLPRVGIVFGVQLVGVSPLADSTPGERGGGLTRPLGRCRDAQVAVPTSVRRSDRAVQVHIDCSSLLCRFSELSLWSLFERQLVRLSQSAATSRMYAQKNLVAKVYPTSRLHCADLLTGDGRTTSRFHRLTTFVTWCRVTRTQPCCHRRDGMPVMESIARLRSSGHLGGFPCAHDSWQTRLMILNRARRVLSVTSRSS